MSQSSPHSETTTQSSDLGRKGEELAAAYLQHLGFQIVAANFTVPVGRNRIDAVVNVEIDLVAYEGPVLCFVEVKTRRSDWFAPPIANVDLRKQRQVTRAARVYQRMFGLSDERSRFDVVSIVLQPADIAVVEEEVSNSPATNIQIELLRNFWSEEKFRKPRPSGVHWD
ncbi:MAG: YraN family protein [Pyrinomonadaceae bacterium]